MTPDNSNDPFLAVVQALGAWSDVLNGVGDGQGLALITAAAQGVFLVRERLCDPPPLDALVRAAWEMSDTLALSINRGGTAEIDRILATLTLAALATAVEARIVASTKVTFLD